MSLAVSELSTGKALCCTVILADALQGAMSKRNGTGFINGIIDQILICEKRAGLLAATPAGISPLYQKGNTFFF